MLVRFVVMLLKGYQWVISPLLGPNCRFYPSCSQYTIEALREYGLIRGSWLAVKRLVKCHPYHPGGYDPVSPEQQCSSHQTSPHRENV